MGLRGFEFVGISFVATLVIFLYPHTVTAGTEVQITSDTFIQYQPSIDDNRTVWIDNRNGGYDVYMYNLVTQTEERITTNGTASTPAISGNRIVWVDSRNDNGNDNRDIYMFDLATQTETQVTTNIGYQNDPAISGDKIVWTDYRNSGQGDVYMFDLTTQTETRITNSPANQYAPSIDGNRIVWTDTRNGNEDIYLLDLITNNEIQVTTNFVSQNNAVISGDRIVWEDSRNGLRDLYLYNIENQTEIPLITNVADQSQPSISGNKIAWMDDRNVNGVYDIYSYDLIAQIEEPVTTFSGSQYSPSISGNRVVWSSTSSNENNVWDIYLYDSNPNIAPVAQIGDVSTITLGQLVTFDGSESSDTDGTIVSYQWDFGDGSTGSGAIVHHTYATTGTYQVALTVTDNDGTSNTASISVAVVKQLTSLTPAKVWIGIKNSDAVGIKFDLKAEVYKDGALVTSGQLDSVSGGSSGFGNARLNAIPFASISPVDFPDGSSLSIKVLVRNACVGSGKNSGTARLWFNDSAANSQFGAIIAPITSDYYLLDGFLLGTSVGPGPKKNIDVAAGAKCSPFKEFGTWAIVPN